MFRLRFVLRYVVVLDLLRATKLAWSQLSVMAAVFTRRWWANGNGAGLHGLF